MEIVKAARNFVNNIDDEYDCYDIYGIYIEGVKYIMNELSKTINEYKIHKAASSFESRVLNSDKIYDTIDRVVCGAKWAIRKIKEQ